MMIKNIVSNKTKYLLHVYIIQNQDCIYKYSSLFYFVLYVSYRKTNDLKVVLRNQVYENVP